MDCQTYILYIDWEIYQGDVSVKQSLKNLINDLPCLICKRSNYPNFIAPRCATNINDFVTALNKVIIFLEDNNIFWHGENTSFSDRGKFGYLILKSDHLHQVFVNDDGSSKCITYQLGKSNKLN